MHIVDYRDVHGEKLINLIDGTDYLSRLTLFVHHMPPGKGYERHADPDYDLGLILLSGVVELHLGGRIERHVAPKLFFVRHGTIHGMNNVGTELVKLMVLEIVFKK
jgi:quercetin dioxygenase-like cupin family protein